MTILVSVLSVFVAAEHFFFLILEMALWTKPFGRKTFGNSKELAEQTKVLAANQGLYNGFITAGILWGLFHPNPEFGHQVVLFFLVCATAAGIFGGITANRTILYIQTFPALITGVLVYYML